MQASLERCAKRHKTFAKQIILKFISSLLYIEAGFHTLDETSHYNNLQITVIIYNSSELKNILVYTNL